MNCCCFGAPTEAPDEEKGVQEARDVQLEVVRDVGGRPLFLTTRRFIRVRTCKHVPRRVFPATDQPIGDWIDESQLRRYAELMEDFRRENESKKAAQAQALSAPENGQQVICNY